MFTCGRKEPPPSAHLFNKFWDIATETKIEDYFASARIAAAGGEGLDGVLYNIGDGTIATRQGARVWVANAKRPASVRPTDEYFSIIELNGKIYWGGMLKAGTRFKSADGVTPGLINDYTIRLNSQAVNSVKATVKF